MTTDAAYHPRQGTTLGTTPAGRIFKSFRLWPAVPVSDLLRLRHVLELRLEADRSDEAQELLHLVDVELARRCASPGGIIPPTPTINREQPCPEAG